MILYGFLALIVLSSAVALLRWRWGLVLVLLVGVLQDPLRKLIPGVPGYLTLSTIPVWFFCMIGALRERELRWESFCRDFPKLTKALMFFFAAILPAAVMSATYSSGSWQITILGVFSVIFSVGAVLLGYRFPRRDGDIEWWIACYCVLTSVAMIGVVLERFQIETIPGLLGTDRLGTLWVTYRTGGVVRMLAGFYRSPDVMGWHAAFLICLSLLLALRKSGGTVGIYAMLSAWGGVALMLCARRKMLGMVLLFLAVYGLLLLVHKQGKRLLAFLAVGLLILSSFLYFYGTSRDQEVDKFLVSTFDDASGRFSKHAVESAVETIRQAGVFGYGLGMTATGAHHLKVKRPPIWQEGGVGKVLADIGVLGAMALIALFAAGASEVRKVTNQTAGFPHALIYFGLTALLAANLMMGVVSAQIFGDPWISTLLPFTFGLLLSGYRLQVEEKG